MFVDPGDTGCASEVSFNLKGRTVLPLVPRSGCSNEATLPPFTERGASLLLEECVRVRACPGTEGGGREESCNHPNNHFYPFRPFLDLRREVRKKGGVLASHAGPQQLCPALTPRS